jgi:hypothetical protein
MWFSLERAFQELENKSEILGQSIEYLEQYKTSLDKHLSLFRLNLNSLRSGYEVKDEQKLITEQHKEEV